VNVTVGGFRLSRKLVAQVQNFRDVPAVSLVAERSNLGKPVHVAGDAYYVGTNPIAPTVGDLRVTFRFAPAGDEVTVIGQQVGQTFTTWGAEGNTLEPRLVMDEEDVDTMFDAVETESPLPIWAFRAAGAFLAFFGFMLMLHPLVPVASEVPVIGPLVQGGAALVSLALSLGTSLLTISIGWLVYRPLIGVPLVLLALGTMVSGVVLKVRRKKPKPTPSPAAPTPPAGPASA
jgi:hypothetical protein